MRWLLILPLLGFAAPSADRELSVNGLGDDPAVWASVVKLEFTCWRCVQVSGDDCEHPEIIYHIIPPAAFGGGGEGDYSVTDGPEECHQSLVFACSSGVRS
jgi:hypothetical protein